ncbi:14052_t:CDS:1, partial [Racocetra persica]
RRARFLAPSAIQLVIFPTILQVPLAIPSVARPTVVPISTLSGPANIPTINPAFIPACVAAFASHILSP